MTTISQIEADLAQAGIKTKDVPAGPKRQAYLKSLVNAARKLSDDEWESLPEATAEWVAAAGIISDEEDIPDFPDLVTEEEPEPEEEPEVQVVAEPEPKPESEPVQPTRRKVTTERKPRATKVNLIGTIEKWEQEAAKYEAQLAEVSAKYQAVCERLDAIRNMVAKLNGNGEPKVPKEPKEPKTASTGNGATLVIGYGGLADSILEVVKAAPVSRKELKARLENLGYPKEKLGPNFYVSITRLAKKNLIQVSESGELTAV